MRNFIYNHKRGVIAFFAVIFVVIIGISLYFITMSKIYSASVVFRVTPLMADIVIDNKHYESIKTYDFKPGEYIMEVSAEGFVSKTESFEAIGNETVSVDLYLEPVEENEDWYKDHPDDALVLGEIKNALSVKAVKKLYEDNQILNELPMNIDYYTNNSADRVKYTISYKFEENNTKIVLTITDYTGGNYDDAISRLEKRGVAKDQYEIKYVDKSSSERWGRAGD